MHYYIKGMVCNRGIMVKQIFEQAGTLPVNPFQMNDSMEMNTITILCP